MNRLMVKCDNTKPYVWDYYTLTECVNINRIYQYPTLRLIMYPADETFRAINLPFAYGYIISKHGTVYNTISKHLIRSCLANNGYMQIRIGNYNCLLHRLVLQTFKPIPDPENYQVNHIDCDKTNNDLDNLEWVNSSENMLHAYANDLAIQGEAHPWSKLNTDQVHIICQGLQDRLSYRDICKLLGVEYDMLMSQILTSIRQFRNWKSISKYYKFPEVNWNKQEFTNDEIHIICKCFEKKMKTYDILRKLGVVLKGNGKYDDNSNIYELVGKIRRRTTFVDISKNYNF